jgi:FixJ family two-component response regulator
MLMDNTQEFTNYLEDNLTRQEFAVLKLAVGDLCNKQIATYLNISETTVKKHRQNIAQKCNLKGKQETRRFLRQVEKIFSGN